MKKLITCLAISTFMASASAETAPFTYNFNNNEPTGYRKFKSKPSHDFETIDVAIFISGALEGKRVTSISVPVMGEIEGLSDFSAFITTKLATRNDGALKYNDPDVCSVPASLDGFTLTATFPEPYTITDKGVYVGYSFTDNSMKAMPVAVVPGDDIDSFWYRGTEANAKWTSLANATGFSSAATVFLEGEIDPYAVAVSGVGQCVAAVNEPGEVEVSLANMGRKAVESIEYIVNLDGSEHFYEISFDSPEPAILGFPFTASLEIPATDRLGSHDLKITVDKVNGEPNGTKMNSTECVMEVYPFVPKNRPLVEEYTGLNCGWCPGGYVMLRQMHDKHGIDNFVAISYHIMLETGCMVHLDEFPYNPSGIPAAQINRTSSPAVADVPGIWELERQKIAAGEIEVELKWADDAKTEMAATSRTRFISDNSESPYLVSFCVVADGMSNPAWVQYNAYANASEEDKAKYTGDYWDLFIGEGKGMNIPNLVFDEIAVLYPDQNGVPGSLPGQVVSGEWYESSFSFKPEEIVNVKGEHVITDIEKIRVIAMIVDKNSGEVINCASSLYADGTGSVGSLGEDAADTTPVYYNLQGTPVANPGKGVFIKVQGGKATKIIR